MNYISTNSECKRWRKIMQPARQLFNKKAAILQFPECSEQIDELGQNLSFWKLSSNRLMIIDEDSEFGYTWCHARAGWNEMDWDLVLALTNRCTDDI